MDVKSKRTSRWKKLECIIPPIPLCDEKIKEQEEMYGPEKRFTGTAKEAAEITANWPSTPMVANVGDNWD